MKSLLGLLMIFVSGCAMKTIDETNIGQPVGVEQVANVGDVFFFRERFTGQDNHFGTFLNGEASRSELSVRSASKDKLELEYAEYTKPEAKYGGYQKESSWLKKAAFSKTLQYDIKSSNTFNYDQFSFKILDVSNNQVRYQRLK